MARRPLTEELARAAARDAGNRSMRSAGRSVWDEEDFRAAALEYERLWPAPRDAERVRTFDEAPPPTTNG